MTHSDLENLFAFQIKAAKLPTPKREYRAIPGRRFRWDLAYPEPKILIEIHGGIWIKGGHSTGTGIGRDCEKLNLASLAGFHCFAFTGEMVKDGRALKITQEALQIFEPF